MEMPWNKPVPGYDLKQKARVPVWKRAAALLTDLLIFDLIVAVPLSAAVTGPVTTTNPDVLAAGAVMTGLFFGYLVAAQYLTGQTAGMLLFRYEVTPTHTLWRVLVRNVFIIPAFPFIILWIIDPLFLLFTGDRLSERWSGTRVIP